MFVSKKMMEGLPNIHLIAVFIVAETVVYRKKALYPIYVYVLLDGLFVGFNTAWVPYLYIWTLLWAASMLIPRRISYKLLAPVGMVLCALHGILFGVLYAPSQALLFGLSFNQTLAWIAAGFYFDVLHCIGNFVAGLLTVPIVKILREGNRLIR